MPKVVYLTGAPAAGKSSTTRLLRERVPELLIWEHGAKLTEHCAARSADVAGQDDLRARSASLITVEDVAAVDQALLDFVDAKRDLSNVIIDSHPVTKEEWGYRITPFSFEQFARLKPDEIWVLYASPEESRRRIQENPGGRPLVTEEEARTHTMVQASVAATYGMSIRCPVYMFHTEPPRDELVSRLAERLS
jgi:adenylate kinase